VNQQIGGDAARVIHIEPPLEVEVGIPGALVAVPREGEAVPSRILAE